MPSDPSLRAPTRRLPLLLVVVLATLMLSATGSLAVGEVGIPLRATAPDRSPTSSTSRRRPSLTSRRSSTAGR